MLEYYAKLSLAKGWFGFDIRTDVKSTNPYRHFAILYAEIRRGGLNFMKNLFAGWLVWKGYTYPYRMAKDKTLVSGIGGFWKWYKRIENWYNIGKPENVQHIEKREAPEEYLIWMGAQIPVTDITRFNRYVDRIDWLLSEAEKYKITSDMLISSENIIAGHIKHENGKIVHRYIVEKDGMYYLIVDNTVYPLDKSITHAIEKAIAWKKVKSPVSV